MRDQQTTKIISQLEFWFILFALAAAPNWSWPVWGSAEESRMIAIGLTAGALALLELIRTLTPASSAGQALTLSLQGRGDNIDFGFFKSPLNWIISVPLFLVIAGAAKDGVLFVPYQALGFGVPWPAAVLPVFLLLAWHFLLRGFFGANDISEARGPLDNNKTLDKFLYKGPLAPAGRGLEATPNRPLLKFAFVWLILFATIGLIRRTWIPASAGMTTYFVLGSILALVLVVLRVPLSAPARSYRLGRLIYVPFAVLLVALGLFIRFEIRVARAAAAASGNDFAAARRFNPYHPLYAISWVEQEIAGLEKMDLTADVAAAKEKVGEIVKGLDGLSSWRGIPLSFPRPPIRSAGWRTAEAERESSLDVSGLDSVSGAGMTLRIARAWERLGKFAEGASEKAVAVYDAIIAAQGAEPDLSLIIKKALLLEKAGRANEAIEWLQSFVTLERGREAIESSMDSIGRPPAPGRRATSGMTPTLEIQYHLGRLLYNSGKADEAAAIWQAILKEDPDYVDVNYSLGAYFARPGKNAEALRYFEKVWLLAPDNAEVKKRIDELKSKR